LGNIADRERCDGPQLGGAGRTISWNVKMTSLLNDEAINLLPQQTVSQSTKGHVFFPKYRDRVFNGMILSKYHP
jgi:hypothetical protein